MDNPKEIALTSWQFDHNSSDSWNDFLDELGVPPENRARIKSIALTISDYKVESW